MNWVSPLGLRRLCLLLLIVCCPWRTINGRAAQALTHREPDNRGSDDGRHVDGYALREAALSPDVGAKLAFSRDGQLLVAIGSSRAITYDAITGAVRNIVNLRPDTNVLSVTSDGRTAFLSVPISGGRVQLTLLDTQTGVLAPIPLAWYEPTTYPDGALSGDGNLISIYSESGSETLPLLVTVYDWHSKTLVARIGSKRIAAGGLDSGGLTADGAVELANDRVGRKIVDLRTRRLISWFTYDSVRSANGAWVVELPDRSFNESASSEVLIKEGVTGKLVGKLDVQVEEQETHGGIQGAFCGVTNRFVLGSAQRAAIYLIPSGALIASFPPSTWRGQDVGDADPTLVACSSDGKRVAIFSGARLTLHNLK